MTYEETLEYLFTQTTVFQRDGASAYKPGLDTALKLSAAFGNPHRRLRAVHIAGTNGKGSTAHTLAAIFQSAGLRTGLYTSPHLTDFRERIRVNGQMIAREAVTDFVARYLAKPELISLRPSFFELTTIMAFEWFERQGIDIAVIETGLGGRLDTTNIITPLLSVITNISLDHTGLLGSTLPEIAFEKAGIIKPGVPVVVGPRQQPEVAEVFMKKAEAENSPIVFAPEVESERQPDGTWVYNGHIHGSLRGAFQPLNASTVLAALSTLNLPEVTFEAVEDGFERVEELTGLRGRLTSLPGYGGRVVYDTGHNPGAWIYISDYLCKVQSPRKEIVIGFAADKDVDSILGMLEGVDAEFVFTRPSGNRGLDADELSAMASRHGLKGCVEPTVAEAFNRALRQAGSDGFVFIGGSNFVIADLLS